MSMHCTVYYWEYNEQMGTLDIVQLHVGGGGLDWISVGILRKGKRERGQLIKTYLVLHISEPAAQAQDAGQTFGVSECS